MPHFTTFLALAFLLLLPAIPAQAQVLVNQSGYNTAESKRFTAPLAADGTPFSVVTEPGGSVVFTGTVNAGVGDFTALQPVETGNFRVVLGASPEEQSSYVFGIGPFWMERVSYRRMIQFFIDSRAGYGDATTWNVAGGKFSSGIAWRDSHQFSFELRTLIQWYAANPDAFGTDRMPAEGLYAGLRNTLPADTPEIVRLIHWGVDIYLRGGLNHTLIKEELAYFLYYYPLLQRWIPVSLYNEARDYLFPLWSDTARDRWNWYDITHTGNLFQTYTVMGGTKGSFPPGHSIVPNLLMHAVALREGRSDAASYRTAARNQVQWIVNNLDPANPIVTKGQRMSEHILVPALAEFMMRDPQTTVTGVDAWLASWADVVISRSNNYWDFRKYSDTIWTPENVPGSHPWWNEPGNIAGFPASALAAITRLQDTAKIQRLRQIAVSQLDQVFGRNPHNRHFSFRAAQANYGFEGVEAGWFSQHIGGLGDLVNVRGVLDASAKHLSFPYNPEVSPGYVEGWIAFNSAWNAAMVWAARDRSSITFVDPEPGAEVSTNGNVGVQLSAPLNFDRNLAETASVRVTGSSGDIETILLTETGPDTSLFRGWIPLNNTAVPTMDDGSLDAVAGESLTASYGHDIFARSASATAATAGLVVTTSFLPDARLGVSYPPLTLGSANGQGSPVWEIISGRLPSGMELLANGLIQGTPTESGVFQTTFRVTAAQASALRSLSIICSSFTSLQITTPNLLDVFSGELYQQPLAVRGALGTVTWSLAAGSSLPSGITLDPSGSLIGTTSAVGTHTFALTASDASGSSATAAYELHVIGRTSHILDAGNSGTSFVGTWTSSTYFPGFIGSSYHHDGNTAKGDKSVSFAFTSIPAGTYSVSATWIADENRARSAPYRCITSLGDVTFFGNHQGGNGSWNPLGDIVIPADGQATVILGNADTDGFVIADAVRLSTADVREATRFQRWIEILPEESREPAADPDGDGLQNLVEYYLNQRPDQAGRNVIAPLRLHEDMTASVFHHPGLSGVNMRLMGSHDLIEWQEVLSHAAIRDLPADFEGERQVNLQSSPFRFFRLVLRLAE